MANNLLPPILAVLFCRAGQRARSKRYTLSRHIQIMMSTANREVSKEELLPEKEGGTVFKPKKLHGRAFYESLGSPRFVLAPMVDQSEFVILPHVLSKDSLLIMLTTGMASPHSFLHDTLNLEITSCIHPNASLTNVHGNGKI